MTTLPADLTDLLAPSYAAENIVRMSNAAYYLACEGIDPECHLREVERSFLRMSELLGFDVVKRAPAGAVATLHAKAA